MRSYVQVLSDVLLFGRDVKSSVDSGRVEVPSGEVIVVEDAFEAVDVRLEENIRRTGANVTPAVLPYTTTNAIEKVINNVVVYSDLRSGARDQEQV
jgi:gamma-glutamyltranspeptidase